MPISKINYKSLHTYYIIEIDEEIGLCMSSITEGLCSPLASRVESILHMNENPIDLYGVASSLKFYLQIVIKVSLKL